MSWGAAIGGIAGGLFGMWGQSSANQSNAQMAERQMEFQERMSNTAHVRARDDMKSAGLNPILMAGGGQASSPAGAMGNAQNEMAPIAAGLESATTSALDAKRLQKEIGAVDSQKKLNELTGKTQEAIEKREQATAKEAEARTKALNVQMKAIETKAKAEQKQAEWDIKAVDFDNLNKRINQGLGTVNSAKDALLGLPRGTYRNQNPPRLKKDQIIINDKTGEVIQP